MSPMMPVPRGQQASPAPSPVPDAEVSRLRGELSEERQRNAALTGRVQELAEATATMRSTLQQAISLDDFHDARRGHGHGHGQGVGMSAPGRGGSEAAAAAAVDTRLGDRPSSFGFSSSHPTPQPQPQPQAQPQPQSQPQPQPQPQPAAATTTTAEAAASAAAVAALTDVSFSTVGSDDADAPHLDLHPLREASRKDRGKGGQEAEEAVGPALVPPPWSKEKNLTLRRKAVPIVGADSSSPLRPVPHQLSTDEAAAGPETAPRAASEKDVIPPQLPQPPVTRRRGDSTPSS